MTARSPTQLIAQPFLQLNLCVKDKFAVSQSTLAPREKRGRMVEWVKVCTYDQHRRSHHLGDTLPEFSSGAWFTQTSCKFPGLRVRWGGHRYAPFRISDPSNPGATIIDIQRKSIQVDPHSPNYKRAPRVWSWLMLMWSSRPLIQLPSKQNPQVFLQVSSAFLWSRISLDVQDVRKEDLLFTLQDPAPPV